MIYLCLECDRSFDADTEPSVCPFCGSGGGFGEIRIRAADGRELTYKEHMEQMRQYYMKHLPFGLTQKDIEQMDDAELENMSDILNE